MILAKYGRIYAVIRIKLQVPIDRSVLVGNVLFAVPRLKHHLVTAAGAETFSCSCKATNKYHQCYLGDYFTNLEGSILRRTHDVSFLSFGAEETHDLCLEHLNSDGPRLWGLGKGANSLKPKKKSIQAHLARGIIHDMLISVLLKLLKRQYRRCQKGIWRKMMTQMQLFTLADIYSYWR